MTLSSSKLSLINIPVLMLSLLFFWDSILWMQERLAVGLLKPFNLLAVFALGFFAYKRLNGRGASIFKPQAFPILPVVVMAIGVGGYSLLDMFFGIRTFNTLAFLFFIFGYVGLFVNQAEWLKSSIPILLLTLILPFGDLLDTYLGFPLRMQTSNAVESIVRKLGVELVDHQTILSLENKLH